MNFKTTSVLLESIKHYIINSTINISTENKDWRNRKYKSDFVTIDDKNNIGFEVLENEIIVFYFTDHTHFEDYTSKSQDGKDNYIERAKTFLKELFEHKIQHIEYYKGKSLFSEKYFLLYNNGNDNKCIGNILHSLFKIINPFAKKSTRLTIWQFDISKGIFTTRQPKRVSPNAVEVIDISEDCYIEIFYKHNCYTYEIMEIYFNEYSGMFYWTPAENINPSGFYDNKEKAINAAMYELKHRSI